MTLLRIHRVANFCLATLLCPVGAVMAQEKVTFADHVLPLVEQHCAKCHNPDKKKGDLDLTSHSGVLRGGGTGPVVVSGNAESSKLIKSLTHAEEPAMPPNKAPLPDKELAVFRKWIVGGLLETSGSKAIVTAKPKVDLTLKVSDLGKPDGPPPMPKELPIDPIIHTKRTTAVSALAASPWAPLVAIAGQKQVLLYNSTNRELVGVLPFPDGQPQDVRFSRSGKMILAAGGHGAKSGAVTLWNVETGERVTTVGKEYDAVLTADLSADQSRVAMGGSDRLLKVYSTKTGELEHKIKKHTDWVTAVAFSPNGEMIASGDRNGGVSVWDADSGQELFTTAGHKSAVTALSWRSDAKLLASGSEDGSVTLWEASEGKQSKTWAAHKGGTLAVAYARDGRLVSCGRDGAVIMWGADGAKLKTMSFGGELALRCAWVDDGARVVAGDFSGNVWLWDAKSGKQIGALEVNPMPLADRIAAARERIAELQARGEKPAPAVALADKELADARALLLKANVEAEKALAEFVAGAQEVVRLKDVAAKAGAALGVEAQLTSARAAREQARVRRTDATNAVAAVTKKVEDAKVRIKQFKVANDPATEMAAAKAELNRLLSAQARSMRVTPQDSAKR